MKYILPALLITALIIAGCSDDNFPVAENAADAAREFVDASLKGNHRKAYHYLLKDSTNEMMFETWKKSYNQLDAKQRSNFKDASIIVLNLQVVNDSVSTFQYYPSANVKDTTTLRVIRHKGLWQVDLKSVIKI